MEITKMKTLLLIKIKTYNNKHGKQRSITAID